MEKHTLTLISETPTMNVTVSVNTEHGPDVDEMLEIFANFLCAMGYAKYEFEIVRPVAEVEDDDE